MLHADLATMESRTRQDRRGGCRRESTKTLGVCCRLNLMQQLQVSKIVYIYLVLQYDHNPIPSQPNSSNFRSERKLPDAATLVIIPDHNLVCRVSWGSPPTHHGQDITPKKHLHKPNSTIVELPSKRLFERIAIINPETCVRPAGEATIVLIKPDRQQGARSCRQLCLPGAGGRRSRRL